MNILSPNLQQLFYDITGMAKRLLASKYLHFHKPKHFFIYDSRADSSIRKLTAPEKCYFDEESGIDSDYAKFCLRGIKLRDEIKDEFGTHLTPRQIDKLLLDLEE